MSMTEEEVRAEQEAAGLSQEQLDEINVDGITNLENWMRYGEPGALQLQMTGANVYTTEDGTHVSDGTYMKIITDSEGHVTKLFKQPMGEDFNPLKYIQDGESGYVGWDLGEGAMKNADNGMQSMGLDENTGYYGYFNGKVKTGMLGTGWENAVNQMPDSMKAVVEYGTPLGFADVVMGGNIMGQEFHADASGELGNVIGKDGVRWTETGMQVAAQVGAAVAGGPAGSLALNAAIAGSNSLSGKPPDWKDVAIRGAIGFIPGAGGVVAGAAYDKSRGASWEEVGTNLAVNYAAGYAGQAAGSTYGSYASAAVKISAGYARDPNYDPSADLINLGVKSAFSSTSSRPPVAGNTSFTDYNKSVWSDLNKSVSPSYYQRKYLDPIMGVSPSERSMRDEFGLINEISGSRPVTPKEAAYRDAVYGQDAAMEIYARDGSMTPVPAPTPYGPPRVAANGSIYQADPRLVSGNR